MITLNDIAKASKCSISTVSMSLSDHPKISKKTKQDVLRISRKLGYKPPRERMRSLSAVARSSCGLKRIGFFLMGDTYHHEVYPTILQVLATNASSRGIRFEMASHDPAQADTAVEKMLAFAKGVDGMIVTGHIREDMIGALVDRAIPHVVIGHYAHDTAGRVRAKANIVDYDYLAMGKLAVEYLARQGHTRIGFVCETLPEGLYYSRWLEGYRLGLANLNLPQEASLIHVAGKSLVGGGPAAEAFAAQKHPPTAFLVPEVRTASSFIHAMKMLGRDVNKKNIVIASATELIEKYNLKDYPLIAYSEEWLAVAALRQLIHISETPLPFSTELYVPFTTNMNS
jgi:DNA-binding LacI/PurR family transcriptional regulator